MKCKNLQWSMINGSYTLEFALPLRYKGVERLIPYLFRPPSIPKTVKTYNQKLGHYENITVNDDNAAFRVLFWYIKNKLIAIRTGLVSAEEEMMAHIKIKMPDGRPVTLIEKFHEELPMLAEVQNFALTDEKKAIPAEGWTRPGGKP